MTYILALALGFLAGIYRNEIYEKAKELYIKISEKR